MIIRPRSFSLLLALAAISTLAAPTAGQNYQVQKWNGSRWVNYDPPGSEEVAHSNVKLDDVRVATGSDYFEWDTFSFWGWDRFRIHKDALPKKSVKNGFQQAADHGVFVDVYMDGDGKLLRIELEDKELYGPPAYPSGLLVYTTE